MPSVFSNWPLEAMRYRRCTGELPGRAFTAPGRVIAVAYNGITMRPQQLAPALSFSAVAESIMLNFDAQEGDRIDALCISY